WSWGRTGEGYSARPSLRAAGDGNIDADHPSLGDYRLAIDAGGHGPELLFTDNETNNERLYGVPNANPYVKDAFHGYVVNGRTDRVNPAREGTKAAALFRLTVPAGGEIRLRLRLTHRDELPRRRGPFDDFEAVVA